MRKGEGVYKRRELKKAYADWLQQQHFTIFATVNFVDGSEVNETEATKRLRFFFNKLDRKVKTHKEVKEGKRLERHVYIEKGRSRQNIHAHFFTKGSTLKETKSIIYNAQHIWQTVDKASDIEVSLIENNDGIKGYCTKELDTVDTDILLTDCTH